MVPAGESGPERFPPFPGDADYPVSVVHHPSDAEIVVEGSDFVEEEGQNNGPGESGPSAYIIAPSDEDDLAWALYGIGNLDLDRPVDISIELTGAPLEPGGDDPLPLEAWIGLSNYSDFSWEWFGPYEDSVELVLNSAALHDRYVSSANSFYFTVVTDASQVGPGPGNPLGLSAVEIIASTTSAIDANSPEYHATTPHYPTNSGSGIGGGKGGSALDPASQYVTVNWDHLTDTASADCEATHYDVYRHRIGSNGGMALLGSVAAPDVDFVDPVDTRPLIGPVVPGEEYEYTVVARNAAGSSAYAYASRQNIPLLPPGALSATDGVSLDWVRLEWERAEGAVSYEIFRDNQDAPYQTIGNSASWTDSNLPDTAAHTYWIRGINQFGTPGQFSAPDDGWLNIPPIAVAELSNAGMAAGNPPHDVEFVCSNSSDPNDPSGGTGIILYEWDAQGDGDFEYSSATADNYSFIFQNPLGVVTATLKVTDTGGATDTDTIDLFINRPPVAVVETQDPIVLPGVIVMFSAANSFDPDPDHDSIANYEWDFNGNMIFNEITNQENLYIGLSEAETIYINSGIKNISVRVTDTFGAQHIDTVSITVT